LVVQRASCWRQLHQENERLRRQLEPHRREDQPEPPAAAPTAASDGDNVSAVARNLAGKPLADIEKQVILRTLEQFKGHRLRTAVALGIGVRTLGMKIKRWRDEGEPIAGRQPRPTTVLSAE